MAKKNEAQLNAFAKILAEEAEAQIIQEQQFVDYEIREYPIEVLVSKFQKNRAEGKSDIFIPDYQREFVWDEAKQSEFIESLLLGLPVPYMFSADSEGRQEIVDGSQRLRTMEAFLDNALILEGLEKLSKFNGLRFGDLLETRQKRFAKKTIRLIELTEKADIEVRRSVFERINKNATLLTDMEIRKGLYSGPFMDFLEMCATYPRFMSLCPVSDSKKKRGERRELVTRFFAFGNQLEKFIHRVDEFLDNYTKQEALKFKEDATRSELLWKDFTNMIDFVEKYFPHGFSKTLTAKDTPRVRFEAIAVGVSLALKTQPDLEKPHSYPSTWLTSKTFEDYTTSDAANNKDKVLKRINYVKNQILGTDESNS